MKVIVVGTNHAGTTAVRTLRRLNPNLEIVTYDKNDNVSFLGCGIALWVKGEFEDPKGLFYASPEILESEGVKVNMSHEVFEINEKEKTVKVKNLKTGEIIEDSYDKLIMALGSWPIIPPIPGIKLDGVKIVKWFQHGESIKKANEDPNIKKIAVCGAGYIGVELVDAFAAKGKDVTLIDIQDRIMPLYYDKSFTDDVEKSMSENGVLLKLGETVKEFKGENGQLKKVVTDKGEYEVDMVIWCVGFRPETQMLKDKVELGFNGAIKVNEYMQSSNKDIYGIGDCIEVYDNAKQSPAYLALATTAVRTGILAAINIIKGNSEKSLGFQGSNAINVFDWCLAGTGMTEEMCKKLDINYDSILFEDNDRPEFIKHHEKIKIKIIWDKKTRKILGAQVGSKENHTEVIYMFSLAIMKGVTIDELPFIDIFFLPHFNKPYNFITLPGLEVAGLNYFKK